MPEISVIIPVYNVEKYLNECLDSVLAQTFKDFEVICVNDGSTDNSPEILRQYAGKDQRVKIVTQNNQGLSMARNNGLKGACGRYVYFVDSDDAIHPQCLELAHFLAETNNADLVCFSYAKIKEKMPKVIHFNTKELKSKTTSFPLKSCFCKKHKIRFNVWTKFYRHDLLDGLEFIPKIHFEDYPHTFAVMARKPKTVIADVPLYFYRINEASISHQKNNPQQIKDYHAGLGFVYEVYSSEALKNEFKLIRRKLVPNILKQQLKRCEKSNDTQQTLMYQAFAEELRDLQQKGLLHWRGHNPLRYWKYHKIMKENG